MIRNRMSETAVTVLGAAGMMPTRPSVALCRCRTALRFSTDPLGRTVEHCDGCRYEGPVRRVTPLKAASLPRTKKRHRDPNACSRGHPWTPENTGWHRRGWRECRQCGRDRTADSKRLRRTG